MKIFIGYDPRQPVAYQVLHHSIISRASRPVSITPLVLSQLPIERKGLTEFTFSRYLVPWLCHYNGTALFLDADMLCLSDIHDLKNHIKPGPAVWLVKNKQRFEWPSLMYFNCGKCKVLTPDFVEEQKPHSLDWGDIGELPKNWNQCVGYDDFDPEAKLIHYTQGIPCFEETKNCDYAQEWRDESLRAMSTVPWEVIMGNSVHAQVMK